MIALRFPKFALFAAMAFFVPVSGLLQAQGLSGGSASTIPQAQLIQPDELNRDLHASGSERPLVLQVGSRVLFEQAHIAGSEYAGPGSQEEGIKALQSRVASLARTRLIVLYCGCCPWNRCPNVGPAYEALKGMGFTRVKVLYIAQNFGTDWVQKGYAVERGH